MNIKLNSFVGKSFKLNFNNKISLKMKKKVFYQFTEVNLQSIINSNND